MKRRFWRMLSLVAMFAGSGALVYFGLHGWRLNGKPMQYVGYILAACAVAGLLGLNIWYGGPLDSRLE